MERTGSTGNGGGKGYPPTEAFSFNEGELMDNPSDNRSPIPPRQVCPSTAGHGFAQSVQKLV